MTIKVYLSEQCQPCDDFRAALKKSGLADEVEIVSIDSDAGFEEFDREVLSKGDNEIPSAYREGKRCQIKVSAEGTVLFECQRVKETL